MYYSSEYFIVFWHNDFQYLVLTELQADKSMDDQLSSYKSVNQVMDWLLTNTQSWLHT